MYTLIFWWLIMSLIIGAGSAFYAKKTNRDPVLWFLLGAVLGLFLLGFFVVFKLRKENKD